MEGANDRRRAKKEPMCSFEAEYTSKGVSRTRGRKKNAEGTTSKAEVCRDKILRSDGAQMRLTGSTTNCALRALYGGFNKHTTAPVRRVVSS